MIGERLAEVRKDHGETQQMLADIMNVSKFTVSSWEQEKSEPSHEILVRLCRKYGVSSDYLLGLSDVDPAYVRRRAEKLQAPFDHVLSPSGKVFHDSICLICPI